MENKIENRERGKIMGRCSKCNSEDLDYGALEIDGEMLYYPFTCESCGAEGKECYCLEYTETITESVKDFECWEKYIKNVLNELESEKGKERGE